MPESTHQRIHRNLVEIQAFFETRTCEECSDEWLDVLNDLEFRWTCKDCPRCGDLPSDADLDNLPTATETLRIWEQARGSR